MGTGDQRAGETFSWGDERAAHAWFSQGVAADPNECRDCTLQDRLTDFQSTAMGDAPQSGAARENRCVRQAVPALHKLRRIEVKVGRKAAATYVVSGAESQFRDDRKRRFEKCQKWPENDVFCACPV